jgi:hypothetical protein
VLKSLTNYVKHASNAYYYKNPCLMDPTNSVYLFFLFKEKLLLSQYWKIKRSSDTPDKSVIGLQTVCNDKEIIICIFRLFLVIPAASPSDNCFLGSMEPFRMESFRIDFLAKPESFRMESFRRNLSENIFSKTGIFQNGIIQKESFRKYF